MMKQILIKLFAGTEILIGIVQCYRVSVQSVSIQALSFEEGVLLAAGFLSFILGLGLLLKKSLAVKSLVFFASGVAFSKVLIMAGIFTLPDVSEILFEKHVENIISLFYHLSLSTFLLRTLKHQP